MIAKPEDWKRLPFEEMVAIPYRASFTARQFAEISRGLIPKTMEDKWFVYFDGGDLSLHRSWTGEGVYQLTIAPVDGSHRVMKAMCSARTVAATGGAYQSELVDFLIHNLLLGEAKPFPQTPNPLDQIPGAYQHVVSATGYEERRAAPGPWWKFWSRLARRDKK